LIKRAVAAAALLPMLCAATAPAAAHPHVFIDNRVTFVFDTGKVTALRLEWTFDEIFSSHLVNQFDPEGDGTFDETESADVRENVLPNLKQFHYFTYIWVDGKPLDQIDPADFVATLDNGIVTFRMRVPLPEPVDPLTRKLAVEVNDREYFVEVALAQQDPVAMENADGVPCKAAVRDDPANAYYGGFVIPQEVSLQCQ
jgi:ABC-type uncharacterized transport system substrate-binding protein